MMLAIKNFKSIKIFLPDISFGGGTVNFNGNTGRTDIETSFGEVTATFFEVFVQDTIFYSNREVSI